MPKLIDADEFKRIAAGCVFETPKGIRIKAEIAIDARPEVDAEPVRHGRWIKEASDMYYCSECGVPTYLICSEEECSYEYCPNCGARMDATDTNVGGKCEYDNAVAPYEDDKSVFRQPEDFCSRGRRAYNG